MGATSFPAAAIVSGTIATSRLGSGTADASSFLRGDQTWSVVDTSIAPLVLGSNLVEQYNGTTGQKARWFKTRTSSIVGEWLELDAATDASNFDIVASRGSAGGAARGIRIGGRQDGGSFVPWVSFATNGAATFSNDLSFGAGVQFAWSTRSILRCLSNGSFRLTNSTVTAGVTLDFATESVLKVRSRLDDADAAITASNITASGDLQIGNAAVAETPTATHTLVIKDSTGTGYRVLAVAV